jgi:hypothetical protein
LALNETYAHRGDVNQHLMKFTAEKWKGPYNQKDKKFETARRTHHLKYIVQSRVMRTAFITHIPFFSLQIIEHISSFSGTTIWKSATISEQMRKISGYNLEFSETVPAQTD